ncbi:MAG: glycosyltransferase [Leadbetterella sp.]
MIWGILILVYGIAVVFASYVWSKIYSQKKNATILPFTIVIAFRNEEKNIIRLLDNLQNLRYSELEIILVNDHSEDNGALLARDYIGKILVRVLDLPEGNFSKKSAIQFGVKQAIHPFVLCTDADCILPSTILEGYSHSFIGKDLNFGFGLVSFENSTTKNTVFSNFQIMEFAALMGMGAVSLQLNTPTMCSGANMAFKKSVFLELNPYESNQNLGSGDDEFLYHTMYALDSKKVAFIKSKDVLVYTEPSENLVSFINQRLRWASKWNSYNSIKPQFLAIFIFLVNLITIGLELMGAWELVMFRYVCEVVFIGLILNFMGKTKSLWYILPLQIVYKYYVVYIGIRSFFKPQAYTWKNRNWN